MSAGRQPRELNGLRAIVLVGGRGTRLQPLTNTRPKPILPIVDVPFLALQLRALADRGVVDVTLACGFKPKEIQEVLGNGAALGITLRYAVEPAPLDTGGAIAFAARAAMSGQLGAPPLSRGAWVVCNGDVLGPPDLERLHAFHSRHGASATIALTPVEDPTRYGLVRTGEDGAVTNFVEKPPIEECDTNLINAGTYLLEDSVFELIPQGARINVEREVFPRLVGKGLVALGSDDYWLDIGTIPTYIAGNLDALAGRVHASSPAIDAVNTTPERIFIDPTASVAADAQISGPCWVGPGVHIAEGCRLTGGVVIGPRSRIARGCRFHDAVILEEAIIGADATVELSVVGEGGIVGSAELVSEFSVIAPDGATATD